MDLKEGQKLDVRIEKLTLGGDGIARVPLSSSAPQGFVVFVPYASTGDEVRIEITQKKKTFARSRIVEVTQKSEDRIFPKCPYYFSPTKDLWCGGCNYQHLDYGAQVREKTRAFTETLKKIAGISPRSVPSAKMEEGFFWRYRNKIQMPFGRDENGSVTAGFFHPASHRIVPIEDCLIHPQEMLLFVRFVLKCLKEWKVAPYSELDHQGWLRHLLVRREKSEGKILATFVTADGSFPYRSEFCSLIQKNFPNVIGICQNINEERTNVILSRKWKTIFGENFLLEKMNGLGAGGSSLKLKCSAGSFFQVNTEMLETMIHVIRSFLRGAEQPRGTLLDLYCGVGGIGLGCSHIFREMIGVDIVPSAIKDAKDNAKLNRITNSRFVSSTADDFLRDSPAGLFSTPQNPIDIVLDPPRSGCSDFVLHRILKIAPEKIVYVSCDPATLARDLKLLSEKGYFLENAQIVDFFPHSSHIESVNLISKKS